MTIFEAYSKALDEDDDIKERAEVSSNHDMKQCMVEEIVEAMTEIRDNKTPTRSTADMLAPLFKCVAFWFLIGIRVGKILRDEELAAK